MSKAKTHYTRRQALKFARMITEAPLTELARYARNQARKNTGKGWRKVFYKLWRWLESGDLSASLPWSVFAAGGNTKLPFFAFSSLPIVTCPGMGECGKYCYSLRAWRYPDAFMRQVQNTILLRFDRRAITRAFRLIPGGLTLRLYVDGDFDSVETLTYWFRMIGQRLDLSVYGYSKSWREFLEYSDAGGVVPQNYMLNLSSGSKHDAQTLERMRELDCVRGEFVAVPIDGRDLPGGFKRYESPEYHRRVRQSAKENGYGKVFSCPGTCGTCTGAGHACGQQREDGTPLVSLTIAIGVH